MPLLCNICNRRVLSHSVILKCSVCSCNVHINCLYDVTKNDTLYVNRRQNKWYCPKCIQSILPFNHYRDDNDFNDAISNTSHNVSFSVENLNQRFVNHLVI